jgi:hypothetical protein
MRRQSGRKSSWPGLTWLDPAIHVFATRQKSNTWMPASSAGMTIEKSGKAK